MVVYNFMYMEYCTNIIILICHFIYKADHCTVQAVYAVLHSKSNSSI
jgi:hypothetical protein